MQFKCSHCHINLSADPEFAGRVVTCPGCNGRVRVPGMQKPRRPGASKKKPGQQTAPVEEGESLRGGWPEADHANVPFWRAVGIGLAASALIFAIMMPFKGAWVSDLILRRTWVNHFEMILFCWSLAILFLKSRKNRHQRDAMLLDILPSHLGGEITRENVGTFIDHIYSLPARLRDSLMVNRIRKGLELFEKRRSNSEVAAMLTSQSEIDATRISGSYTLVKVFLWAIPILGFIGTVLGLSVAVASMNLGSTEEIMSSMKGVTGGLATAFDTTLLGLVLSMALSFPMAAMQKAEEESLTVIDAFCSEKLLPRLDDGGGTAAPTQAPAPQEYAPENFIAPPAGESLPAGADVHRIAAALERMTTLLSQRLTEHLANLELSHQRAITHLRQEEERHLRDTSNAAGRHLAGLEEGIGSLNRVLAELGEKQVIVQQVKRRWFGKS
jgi:MotA/TolQ/ExbB proton channel family